MRVVVEAADPMTAAEIHLSDSTLPLASPTHFKLPAATLSVQVIGTSVQVTCTSVGLALYVWLSTRASGRFARNGLMLAAGTTTIEFLPFAGFNSTELSATIRVEHLAQRMPSQ